MEQSIASKRRRAAARFGAVSLFCLGSATMTQPLVDSNSNSASFASLLRRSLTEDRQPNTDERRPVLYALMNTEGIASQKVTLSCHLHIAAELNRDLVLLPFRSTHYLREGRSRSHALIRLEDYFDNSTERWMTADPYTYSRSMEVLKDAKNNCIQGSRGSTHFTAIPNEEHKRGDHYQVFMPQPILFDWYADSDHRALVASSEDLVESFKAKYSPEENACIVGRPHHHVCARSDPASLDSSKFVTKLVAKGMFNLFSKRGFRYSDDNNGDASIVSYDAIHLRKGDKCQGQWVGPVRCGPALELPFIEMCRSSKRPFYVSTDESDPAFLEELRAAGCVLFDDLGLSLEKEIQTFYSKLGDPQWQSMHPKALSFAMEAHIVKTAQDSYTMGCSSFYYETVSYRKFRNLSPVNLFRETLGEFVEVDPNALPQQKCVQ